MSSPLLHNSLKLGISATITTALAVWFERIEFVWYPLLAVVVVVDDNDDQTVQAATSRILGTVTGGLITFLVHTILAGWIGVLVSLLLMVPVLRMLGWQSSLATAGLVSVMFLMIPNHVLLNWDYVFNRALDTALGCVIAILVGLLFWPREGLKELQEIEDRLWEQLQRQLEEHRRWLIELAPAPPPLPPANFTETWLRMSQLTQEQMRGPRRRWLLRRRWRQRLNLWQTLGHHWVQWERLLSNLPPATPPPETDPAITGPYPLRQVLADLAAALEGTRAHPLPPRPEIWQAAALRDGRPLLQLLALAEEQQRLLSTVETLARLRRLDNAAVPC
ncbi:aromatic acid exporter family protein [Synechococcus sp. CS-1328]|uniref:FUSC family protein n=1 Tax=Synechococcus sp. CS-1328 TaxID=2847976 RepID=UPI00223B4DF2|nr:FUSC family protein [Synechococcus sp. CS-1328]MCT0225661.1 FUSC family protein [Synechococcus sp. CS-1328]